MIIVDTDFLHEQRLLVHSYKVRVRENKEAVLGGF